MKVIGITGQVGSGKSAIAKMMEKQLGVHLILTDEIAKELMKPGQISYQRILHDFGTDILNGQLEIDRNKLSSIVFLDRSKLKILNENVHPYVMDAVKEEIKIVKKENYASAILIETALLIEAGYQSICDEVWYVSVSDETRRKRLKESRGYTDEKIDSILANQLSDDEFREKCTKIIENNSQIEEIAERIQLMLVN